MSDTVGTDAGPGTLFHNRWFWWKEVRQLLPLIGSLVAIAILMVIAHAFGSQYVSWMRGRIELPLLAIPGLFATGAGAVMIGHEREQGTMRWLSTLPIKPKLLVLQKFALAAAGLLITWVIALALIFLLGSLPNIAPELVNQRGTLNASGWQQANRLPTNYPGLVAFSYMVLAAGFYSCWRIKNQFNSLLLLIGCATLPMVIVQICDQGSAMWWRILKPSELSFVWFVASLLLAVVFAVIGYRRGAQALSPKEAPSVPVSDARSAYESPQIAAPMPVFATQLAPIIWQVWRSSRFVLLGLFALFAYTLLHLALFMETTGVLALLPALGFFAVSWLAVYTFKDDCGFQKVRFFADRGINAGTVYWGRQLVGLSLLAMGVLIYIVAIMNSSNMGLSPLAIGIGIVAVYSVSQWVSQLLRMVSVAVILAPILSGVVIGWLVITVLDFDAPIWLVATLVLTPMISTRLMMKRYMDGRDRPRAYVVAVGTILVLLFVPLLPGMATILSAKRMPATKRMGLLAEVKGEPSISSTNGMSTFRNEASVLHWYRSDGEMIPMADEDEFLASMPKEIQKIKPPHRFANILNISKSTPLTALEVNGIGIDFDLQRVLAEAVGESERDGAIEHFGDWVKALAIAVRGLRQSNQIVDQEWADRYEIELLDALSSDLLKDAKDQSFYIHSLSCLPSKEQRRKDRRRALLVAWRDWMEIHNNPDKYATKSLTGVLRYRPKRQFGGYSFHRQYGRHAPRIADAIQPAYIDRLVEILLDAIEHEKNPQWSLQLHQHVIGPDGFKMGPYGPRHRDNPAIDSMYQYQFLMASFWGMEWENEIELLRQSVMDKKGEASNE